MTQLWQSVQMRAPGRALFILLSCIWAIAITNFSRDTFSSAHTAPFIETWLRELFPQASLATIHLIHVGFRKLGHLLEYALFALLLFGCWAAHQLRWQLRWCAYVLGIAAVMAMLDEYHQSFTRQRQASWHDSVIDVIGAALALAVLYLVRRRRFRGSGKID